MPPPLIDSTMLHDQLNDPNWVVVDCRFRLTEPDAGRTLYAAGHIAGARYADLDRDLARKPGPGDGRHPLPKAETFATTLGDWGIDNETTVVVYDDASGAIAARLWWMLRWVGHERVRVLDGGLQAWEGEGFELESSPSTWQQKTFEISTIHDEWIVPTESVPRELERGAALVDARAAERFAGKAEPIDPVAGHIPGANNFPFSEALRADGSMRSPEELSTALRCFAERPGGLIAMCGSGVTACHLLLAASVAELNGRAYIGSWSEWITDPEREIATDTDRASP